MSFIAFSVVFFGGYKTMPENSMKLNYFSLLQQNLSLVSTQRYVARGSYWHKKSTFFYAIS